MEVEGGAESFKGSNTESWGLQGTAGEDDAHGDDGDGDDGDGGLEVCRELQVVKTDDDSGKIKAQLQ